MGSSKIGASNRGAPSRGLSGAVQLVPTRGELAVGSPEPVAPEPVGIVIAGPSRVDPAPRVLAYVWGTAPELVVDEAAEQWAA